MTPVLTLGPLTVTPYGLIVLAGALCGVLITLLRKKESGPVLPFVILGALLFSHMWWVFFCPPGYDAETGTAALMLRIWEGGYTLYGALFGGLLGAAKRGAHVVIVSEQRLQLAVVLAVDQTVEQAVFGIKHETVRIGRSGEQKIGVVT